MTFIVSRIPNYNHDWVGLVWIFRAGKLQKLELKRTRTRWSRFIVSPVPKSEGPGPPAIAQQMSQGYRGTVPHGSG
jgi:hypothetical protein